MKFFVIFGLLSGFYSATALADSDFSVLPVTIKCKSKATSPQVREFEITDMDSDRPDASISDAGLLDVSLNKKTYSVSFSNQCDNAYSVTFKVADLVKLKSGKFYFVTGKLEYFDTWLSEARGDDGETENEVVGVYCTR